MGVNIQRGGHLGVPQQTRHGGYIGPTRYHEARRRVPQRMDVEVLWQAVLLEDHLKALGEAAGSHGQFHAVAAEDIIASG